VGAFYTELLHGSFLVAFVGAPMIEEALKPSGVYFLLAKWPRALRTQGYTALLSMLGGIAFALIENVVYLNMYYAEHSSMLVLWRYTVGVGVHALCSFVFGWGINQRLLASIRGETKFLSYGKRFFITAIVLHSLYNVTVVLFQNSLGIR
jgi:RsiW-degrading membrane proteinase PrsW (M82 family)